MKYKYKINYGGSSFVNNSSLNNEKKWGFGVEQEFPIFIKPLGIDKENLREMGFELELYDLNRINDHINQKPFYFAFFLNFDIIINYFNNYLKSEIIWNDKDLSKIIFEINNFIKKFISLRNKTILSTIIILDNIYDLYKRTISIYHSDLMTIQKHIKKKENIIYEDEIIKIYKDYDNIYITNSINYDLNLSPDIGGFEIRSDNFKNVTVKQVIEELNIKKINIKESLKKTFQLEDDNIIFMDQETMYYDEDDKRSYYSGEPEINITLPYVFPNTDVEDFKKQHINLMKCLQYLSPLFLASFTGSYPNSFGDDYKYFETSYRFQNGSRILVTDVNNIYNLTSDDFDRHEGKTHETIRKIYQNNNKEDPNYDSKIEFSVNRKDEKFNPEQNKFFGFEWKVIDQFPIEYLNNITLLVVMLAQHLQDYNIDITEDPRESFKVLDSVLQKYLNNSTTVSDDSIWPYKFLENVIKEGWNVYMGNHLKYVQLLKDKLSLDKNYLNLDDNKTAFDLLNSLHHSLFDYYKSNDTNTDIIDCFYTNFKDFKKYNELYDLPNVNRRSFKNMVNIMKKNDMVNFDLLKNKVIKNENYDEDYDDYNYYLKQEYNMFI
jgi:hypothetical protein|tara:strand:- start:283 stop:2097 length:1815 start_codon:yes stop_codon:yes gene_type:complete